MVFAALDIRFKIDFYYGFFESEHLRNIPMEILVSECVENFTPIFVCLDSHP